MANEMVMRAARGGANLSEGWFLNRVQMPGFVAKSMNKSRLGNSTAIMACGGFEYVKKAFQGRM